MKVKNLIQIGFWVFVILLIIVFISGVADAQKQNTKEEFETYRQDTLEFLDEHAKEDVNCLLLQLRPTVQFMSFLFSDSKGAFRMWVYPEFKAYDNIHPARVFVDIGTKFNKQSARRDILHEALHLTVNKKGEYICGPDRPRGPLSTSIIPVCGLFGKPVYDSYGITKALEEHLKEYDFWKDNQ